MTADSSFQNIAAKDTAVKHESAIIFLISSQYLFISSKSYDHFSTMTFNLKKYIKVDFKGKHQHLYS